MTQNPTTRQLAKINEKKIPHKDMYPHFQNIFTQNRQKNWTQPKCQSATEWKSLAYPYNDTIIRNKKEKYWYVQQHC